jgi:hypothetical protein
VADGLKDPQPHWFPKELESGSQVVQFSLSERGL